MHSDKVGHRYSAVQFGMMLHSALLWHKLEVKTHKRHLMSWCHGRSIVRVWVKIDRAITEGLGED